MTAARDSIRSAIFASREPKRVQIKFFGQDIEMVQPTLGDIINAQSNDDRQAAVISTLVKYAVIPGTSERIFEDTDADSLLAQPFGQDFLAVTQAIASLTDVDFLGKKPGSAET